jgi:SAM-dependent methyltransferase
MIKVAVADIRDIPVRGVGHGMGDIHVSIIHSEQSRSLGENMLQEQDNGVFNQSCVKAAAEFGVSPNIHAQDHLFGFIREAEKSEAVAKYFRGGWETALFVRQLLGELRPLSTPFSMLEFASGYGRLTRHWAKVLPEALVTACDIHAEAVDFIKEIGAEAVPSSLLPEDFTTGTKYEVVFALSFFTHVPKKYWGSWLRRLGQHVTRSGQLIITTHGEASLPHMGVSCFDDDGFWHAPFSEQKDLDTAHYGATATSFDYVFGQMPQADLRLLRFREAGFGHQDLYVFERR